MLAHARKRWVPSTGPAGLSRGQRGTSALGTSPSPTKPTGAGFRCRGTSSRVMPAHAHTHAHLCWFRGRCAGVVSHSGRRCGSARSRRLRAQPLGAEQRWSPARGTGCSSRVVYYTRKTGALKGSRRPLRGSVSQPWCRRAGHTAVKKRSSFLKAEKSQMALSAFRCA